MTGVGKLHTLTPMPMTKTQVYFRREELDALHRIARARKRPVAELIREAVEETGARWQFSTSSNMLRRAHPASPA